MNRFLTIVLFSVLFSCGTVRGDERGPVTPPVLSPEQQAEIARKAGMPGAAVYLQQSSKTTSGGKTTSVKTGSSVGASGEVTGDKLTLNIDGKPVELSLKDLGLVKSGGFGSSSETELLGSKINLLMVMGGLILAGSIAVWFLYPLFRRYAQAGMLVGGVTFALGWLVTGGTGLIVLLIAGILITGVVIWAIRSGHFTFLNTATEAVEQEAQATQAQADAKSIINAIDKLRSDPEVGPQVQDAMRKKKDALLRTMTPGAQALVASETTT